MHERMNITYNQQDGGILGGNSSEVVYGWACDSSVPVDGREELQSNINLQVSLA